MIALLLRAGRTQILAATAALISAISFADWAVGKNVSLAALYILPMMLAAVEVPPAATVVLAIFCSYLRSNFEVDGSPTEVMLRFVFSVLAYLVSGLFVRELVRKHELVLQHLNRVEFEQSRRKEAEEQLREFVETSPAAILTVDGGGKILAANRAAESLFAMPTEHTVKDRLITNYLPVLTGALQMDIGDEPFRTALQCQGYRETGELFLANMWFSSYQTSSSGSRLAAIVVDSSEEMRAREEEGLRQLSWGNKVAAAAVAHEVRNFCGAINLLSGHLKMRPGWNQDEDLQNLMKLISGLESIAALELKPRASDTLTAISLKEVLDNLRIIIEPDWYEIQGAVRWHLPADIPAVMGDAHGLLQALLNLAQNSHRSVQEGSRRELLISVLCQQPFVTVCFEDTGKGVPNPDKLFQPFQLGAAGAGLGLYISRALIRSYGGDLRYQPMNSGACFSLELRTSP